MQRHRKDHIFVSPQYDNSTLFISIPSTFIPSICFPSIFSTSNMWFISYLTPYLYTHVANLDSWIVIVSLRLGKQHRWLKWGYLLFSSNLWVVTHVLSSIIGMRGVLCHDVTWRNNILNQIVDPHFYYSLWVEITLSLPTIMTSIIVGPLIIALLCIALYVYSKYEAMAWRAEYVGPRIRSSEEYDRRPITPVIFASREYHSYTKYWMAHNMAWQHKRQMMHQSCIHLWRKKKLRRLHCNSQWGS